MVGRVETQGQALALIVVKRVSQARPRAASRRCAALMPNEGCRRPRRLSGDVRGHVAFGGAATIPMCRRIAISFPRGRDWDVRFPCYRRLELTLREEACVRIKLG